MGPGYNSRGYFLGILLTVSLGVSGAQLGLDILKGHSRVPTDLQDLRFSDFLITNDI